MIYFIADIHLNADSPEIHRAFSHFIHHLKKNPPEALYILGDLFDYYLGDDLMDDYQLSIAQLLSQLNCPIYFIVGNRDFLMGKRFLEISKMTLLPERFILTINQNRIILEHGDLLCRHDVGYQKMRKILHCSFLQKIYFYLPTSFKKRLAQKLRRASKGKSAQLTDVDWDYVSELMVKHQANILIHGHTHRLNEHSHPNGKRFVLGDWKPNAPVLCYHLDNLTLLNPQEWSAN